MSGKAIMLVLIGGAMAIGPAQARDFLGVPAIGSFGGAVSHSLTDVMGGAGRALTDVAGGTGRVLALNTVNEAAAGAGANGGGGVGPGVPADCGWSIDLATGTATRAGRTVTHLPDGRSSISGCLADARLGVQKLVRETSCRPLIDEAAGIAREQSRLIYKGEDGTVFEAASCQHRDTDRDWPLTATAKGCPIHHRWEIGQSQIWLRRGYIDEQGRFQETMGCADRGLPPVPHQEIACSPLQTADGGASLPQNRVEITLPDKIPGLDAAAQGGRGRTILGCRPIGPTLTYDAAWCDGSAPERRKYFHDPSAGLTMGAHRVLVGGRPLTACLPDPEAIFAQSAVRVGWRNDDDTRSALPVEQKQLVGAVDHFSIGKPATGTRHYPYVIQGTKEVDSGRSVTLGCATYRLKVVVTVWRRPDGSTLETPLRPAEPAPGGVCGN